MSLWVIHTGGTIGMAATPSGFAPKPGIVEAELADLQARGVVGADVRLRLAEPLIDSANAGPADWNWIMEEIAAATADATCTGVVITHGTDTLAFTAAALAFGLPGLGIPVVLTGSMLALTQEGSDGPRNLAEAFAAVEHLAPGVWVQFAGAALHGARLRKSHSVAFDAFRASPSDVAPLRPAPRLQVQRYDPALSVLVVAVAPGMPADLLAIAAERADGIVLRCYGSGTVPESAALRAALVAARDRAMPVLAVSQCAEGGISLGTYSAGAILTQTGAIDGRDMTVEAAYAKLLFALSASRDAGERRRLLETRLCGEWAL